MKHFITGLGLALALVTLTTVDAHADATCTSLVSSYVNSLNQSGGKYTLEMTIHRSDVQLVSYSTGKLGRSNISSWPLTGPSNQLFSDRGSLTPTGLQPFTVAAADQLTLYVSTTGQLFIHYMPWNFTTQWDLSCSGNVFTRLVPGVGVVTLTLREWSPT